MDETRRHAVLDALSGFDQVWITSAEEQYVRGVVPDARVFVVRGGTGLLPASRLSLSSENSEPPSFAGSITASARGSTRMARGANSRLSPSTWHSSSTDDDISILAAFR